MINLPPQLADAHRRCDEAHERIWALLLLDLPQEAFPREAFDRLLAEVEDAGRAMYEAEMAFLFGEDWPEALRSLSPVLTAVECQHLSARSTGSCRYNIILATPRNMGNPTQQRERGLSCPV